MANIKSQIKRIGTNKKAQERNKAVKSELKTAIRATREAVTSGDKENLALYRVLHLLALGLLFITFVPRAWPALQSKWLQPVMICGEEWLASFCIGVFLSFAGHFVLITAPNSIVIQVSVSVVGIAIMTAIAYYIAWSRRQDEKGSAARRIKVPAPAIYPEAGPAE